MFLNIFFMLKHIMLKLFIELMQTPSTFAFTNAIVKNVCMILVIFNLLFYFILMLVFHTWCGCDDIWCVLLQTWKIGFLSILMLLTLLDKNYACLNFPSEFPQLNDLLKTFQLVYNIISQLKRTPSNMVSSHTMTLMSFQFDNITRKNLQIYDRAYN
jgi:hypothetical protein